MSDKPRVLAVIPARGGSKRLPRKNIMPLNGHPLIAYTIKAAQDSTKLTDWLVSTDDEEIAEVARNYGATVPFLRPAEIAGDSLGNAAVIRHAMEYMVDKTGHDYDILILLQPTCPIRRSEHIDQAVELLWNSPLETLASVRGPVRKPFPNIKVIHDGELLPFNPDEKADEWDAGYIYNAAIYAMKREFFLREGRFVSQRSVPLVMDRFHSTDIDEEVDALVAELYFNYLGLDPFGDREAEAASSV